VLCLICGQTCRQLVVLALVQALEHHKGAPITPSHRG